MAFCPLRERRFEILSVERESSQQQGVKKGPGAVQVHETLGAGREIVDRLRAFDGVPPRDPTITTSRRAKGGLPYHQAHFVPYICAMHLQNSFECHEILYTVLTTSEQHRNCGFPKVCCLQTRCALASGHRDRQVRRCCRGRPSQSQLYMNLRAEIESTTSFPGEYVRGCGRCPSGVE